jgi:D-alanine--poly(phosphoribitol) ligase subunit 2
MTHSEDKILDLLATVTELEEVRTQPDLELYESQLLDSMKTVELFVAFSQELGLEISPAEFDRDTWATPRQLVADIMSRLAAS